VHLIRYRLWAKYLESRDARFSFPPQLFAIADGNPACLWFMAAISRLILGPPYSRPSCELCGARLWQKLVLCLNRTNEQLPGFYPFLNATSERSCIASFPQPFSRRRTMTPSIFTHNWSVSTLHSPLVLPCSAHHIHSSSWLEPHTNHDWYITTQKKNLPFLPSLHFSLIAFFFPLQIKILRAPRAPEVSGELLNGLIPWSFWP